MYICIMKSKIVERNGKLYEQYKYPCTCSCHNPREGEVIMHFMACCDDEGMVTVEFPVKENFDKK